MKYLFKKTLYLVLAFIVISALFAGYRYASKSLRMFAAKAIEDSFGARISIAHMKVRFPLCLQLKGIKINDTIEIAKVYIYPSPASLFAGKTLVFSKVRIVEPVIRIKSSRQHGLEDLFVQKDTKALAQRPASFFVSAIQIENSSFIYDIDGQAGVEIVKLSGNIKANITDAVRSPRLNFKFKGFFKEGGSGKAAPLRVTGIVTRDSAIKAKLQARGVSLEVLGPLYERFLKVKVGKAALNLDSRIIVSKNNLKADCFCKINDIILKDAATQISAPLIATFVLRFDFGNRAVKITNLQTNLLSLIFNRS